MDDNQFRLLLDWWNFSWTGYRKVRKSVKKRVSRHMQELNCSRIADYLTLLETCSAVRKECEKRMTVSISRFWRDNKLWLGLEQDILPDLIKNEKKIIKIWSGGCARGEEVYSLKIIWDRLKATYNALPLLKITATDINPEYLEMARSGTYPVSSLKELPDDVRDKYFTKKKGKQRFEVKSSLKTHINWQLKHLFDDPPGFGFDIIFLRNNLLTYYKNALKKEGLLKVITGLKTNGWLIIGSHEKIPADMPELIRHKKIPWAYNKKHGI
jgi:chemotaxis methyl-accepting protein methylase